jgi:SAM-dependent methyltransferase
MFASSSTYYGEKLLQFGNSAQGVGWKNESAQTIRFEQLVKVISSEKGFSINDLGCGTGAFFNYLNKRKVDFTYRGYDIMDDMVSRAISSVGNNSSCYFSTIIDASEMELANYTVASGIFNLKFSRTNEDWLQYIFDTITVMNEKSIDGFAFNALTRYSDPEFRKEELYYSDPLLFFDFCKKTFSNNVALLHDYNHYDFTILVRKNV